MVFPIRDDNTGRTITPFVNYALIVANVLVFVLLQGIGSNNEFTYAFSTVPQEIATGTDIDRPVVVRDPLSGDPLGSIDLQPTPGSVYLTLLTSMFMHGGIMHLLGNMLFLWIFGDNIEDDLGHARYAAFYLTAGLLASLAHVVTTFAFGQNPYIPSLGASGAISGVMGAYLLLHPRRRVTVFLFRFLTEVPGMVAVGLWFVLQLISGLGLLGGGSQLGGVAYAAHIGGFVAGFALVKLFMIGRGRGGAGGAGPMITPRGF
ncbi:MAG TPA: rhomboid family intramembrane serine protease [Pyrinomonadaceae bacterium]